MSHVFSSDLSLNDFFPSQMRGEVGVLDTNLICSHSLLSDVFQSLCQHPELLQPRYILRVSSKI